MGRPTGCDIRPVIYGIINTSYNVKVLQRGQII